MGVVRKERRCSGFSRSFHADNISNRVREANHPGQGFLALGNVTKYFYLKSVALECLLRGLVCLPPAWSVGDLGGNEQPIT